MSSTFHKVAKKPWRLKEFVPVPFRCIICGLSGWTLATMQIGLIEDLCDECFEQYWFSRYGAR